MKYQRLRTTWFSRDSLITVAMMVPLWSLGGVFWGTAMSLVMNKGSLVGWLIAGAFWAIACWFATAILMLIGFRELVVRIPELGAERFGDRLSAITKKLRYAVEQTSAYEYLCKPARGLLRHIADYGTMRVLLHREGIDLIGPALVVNRVRKELQKPWGGIQTTRS
jgi:hypothetical protein